MTNNEKTTATATTVDKKTVIKGVRQAVYSMIAESKYTKQQIIDVICKDWTNVKAITASTYLSDSKNPKYSKAEKIAIEDPRTKVFSFEK